MSAADSPNLSRPPVTRDSPRRQPDPGPGRLACSSDSAVRLSAVSVSYSSGTGGFRPDGGIPACAIRRDGAH